ncbi:MAG TPA: hypothetical protein VF295_02440 [Candidatus Limnocylindria bacterium]
MTMRAAIGVIGTVALGLLTAACGNTENERMTTGGLGGAAAGALVGGPIGAIVGAGLGVGGGYWLDEGLETKVADAKRDYYAGDTAQAGRESMSGAAERSRAWTRDEVHDKLHEVGYNRVYNIRRDGDVYLARGEQRGRAYDIKVDAMTGRIMSSDPATQSTATRSGAPSGMMTQQQIRDELNRQGYSNVTNLRRNGNAYMAQAMREGQTYDLRVDARSGRVVESNVARAPMQGQPPSGAPEMPMPPRQPEMPSPPRQPQ